MDAVIEAVPPPLPAPAPRLGWLCLSLAVLAFLGDLCFWNVIPLLSVGVFAFGAVGIILLNRPRIRWNRRLIVLLALICGAAVESAIDLCFSNVVVLLALLIALAGESYYDQMRSGWSRWSEALWTMAKTPGRWIAVMLKVAELASESGPRPAGVVRKMTRALWVVGPGLAATLFFAWILGNGNALFAKFAGDLLNGFMTWLEQLDLCVPRFLFWGGIMFLSLPLLWPSPAPKKERIWSKELPLLPELGARTARLQSAVTLGMLNALFCCVNTIDAIYLWAHQAVPKGASYSEFVHHGVAALITAVIFSALLLAGMFHQPRSVAGWTPLRVLGLLWIAQNLVLLASVFLRVKLYVEAMELTVIRVNLVFFLILVGTGFVLLAIHLWGKRTLGWLLNANMLATFFLFYTVQFLDTKSYVAWYNVKQWQISHENHELDIAYLASLGPPAYAAMESLPVTADPESHLRDARDEARRELGTTPWQSWQLRNRQCQRKLLATTAP